jgi:hypothetical protein
LFSTALSSCGIDVVLFAGILLGIVWLGLHGKADASNSVGVVWLVLYKLFPVKL